MKTVSSLIFQIDQNLYGLETGFVKEVIWVPEIFQHPSLPSGIVGRFSYRGTLIPVLDLHHGVGGVHRKLRMQDQIIVVEWQERVVGVLVDKVLEVSSLGIERVQASSFKEEGETVTDVGVVGPSKLGNQKVTMLDLSLVLQGFFDPATNEPLDVLDSGILIGSPSGSTGEWRPLDSRNFEALTPEDVLLLHDRAKSLAQAEPVKDLRKWITLAVVRLNGVFIGIDPHVVREFAEGGDIVPIPCCPDFILGNKNLRGEILTVFDLRSTLDIPVVEGPPLSQVAVISCDNCLFGIAVHEVLDCMSCETQECEPQRMGHTDGAFMKGISQYNGHALQYLDVPHLICSKALEVFEEV